jgi:hypothetical protein
MQTQFNFVMQREYICGSCQCKLQLHEVKASSTFHRACLTETKLYFVQHRKIIKFSIESLPIYTVSVLVSCLIASKNNVSAFVTG